MRTSPARGRGRTAALPSTVRPSEATATHRPPAPDARARGAAAECWPAASTAFRHRSDRGRGLRTTLRAHARPDPARAAVLPRAYTGSARRPPVPVVSGFASGSVRGLSVSVPPPDLPLGCRLWSPIRAANSAARNRPLPPPRISRPRPPASSRRPIPGVAGGARDRRGLAAGAPACRGLPGHRSALRTATVEQVPVDPSAGQVGVVLGRAGRLDGRRRFASRVGGQGRRV